ncbi:glycosyltransferase family 1 protein [Cnuibacter sp. UC19_7]|uniref:rhamnosyltransferase WsaF family glycosyltransferase n=1 Tax=Cnuibacter sp. UC19_7 TaxID=3350166 RepID=UPI003672C931
MDAIKKAWLVLREQGVKAVVSRVITRVLGEPKALPNSVPLRFLVKADDAAAVDWSIPHPAVTSPVTVTGESITFAWIMYPPGESSGGAQNIFRFMKHLEDAGHRNRVYLYAANEAFSPALVQQMIQSSPSYPEIRATFRAYDGAVDPDVDAIFATGWETAYPSFLDPSPARRLYFVQDFEPYFFPVGSEAVLAENSYRFGFEAFTAGGFLAKKLRDEYGMKTTPFEFGADADRYRVTHTGERKEVFFYARPVTARRGFELGILALQRFAEAKPDYTINLAGWDVSKYKIPFAYNNLKNLRLDELNGLYNRCATGLVISLTNMSLLPLELLAAGVIPVINDGPNNRLVSDNPYFEFTEASPPALARRMIEVVERDDLPAHAAAASASVQNVDWATSGAAFVRAVEESLRG